MIGLMQDGEDTMRGQVAAGRALGAHGGLRVRKRLVGLLVPFGAEAPTPSTNR